MILQIIFVGISLILYITSQQQYNLSLCIVCGVMFVLNVIYYYSAKKRKNYFDFDTIFSLTYFITFFIYPIFIFPLDPTRFSIFALGFNGNYINKATCLALVGYTFYLLGRSLVYNNVPHESENRTISYTKDKFTLSFILYLLAIIVFIALGGLDRLSSLYDGRTVAENTSSGIANYVSVCIIPLMSIALITQCYHLLKINKRFSFKKFNKYLFLTLLLFSVLLLSTGSRSMALTTGIALLWIFSYYYYPLSLIKVVLLILVGCLALSIIGILRIGLSVEIFGFIDLFQDLIINNRNTFLALEIVERDGITFGVSMLGYLLRAIPLLSGFIHNLFNLSLKETASSYIFTYETFGDEMTYGVGSNIIADLFLAFGIVGVIIGMVALGAFISYIENGAARRHIYSTLTYIIMMSQSVFIVRADYFWPISIITLCLVFYILISNIVELLHTVDYYCKENILYTKTYKKKSANLHSDT